MILKCISDGFKAVATLLALTVAFTACSESDKKIEAWVEKNPGKILEAIIKHQKAQQEAAMPKPEMVTENAAALFENAGSPTVGDGKIKVVYFFDFNCGHCVRQSQTIKEVLKSGKIQVTYKNFPVLGPSSELAARGALAAQQQNKFYQFYEEAYKTREKTEASLSAIAKKIGLDMNKWKSDLNGETVGAELAHVRTLAEKMRISGTPFLAIAPDKVFPGRVDQLAEIVNSL
jgi:protein-disulfide isomerase